MTPDPTTPVAEINGNSLEGFTVHIADYGWIEHDGIYWNPPPHLERGRFVSIRQAKRAARKHLKRIRKATHANELKVTL